MWMGGVPPLGYRVETTSFESAPPHQRECTCDDEAVLKLPVAATT
jgi:hypothetical protein